jgi:hypothetical protein
MTQIFYALVISASMTLPPGTTNAVFQTREPCLVEAQALLRQGVEAICVPVNQPSPEQAQQQVKAMMQLFNNMVKEMESK